MIQEEIQRLIQMLRVAMRILDVSNRDIEKQLGLSYGYLSRLFSGAIELKVEHILQIVEVLGLTTAEYFQLAYPRRAIPPSDAAVRMRTILDGFSPSVSEERAFGGMSTEEMEKMVARALQKILRDGRT